MILLDDSEIAKPEIYENPPISTASSSTTSIVYTPLRPATLYSPSLPILSHYANSESERPSSPICYTFRPMPWSSMLLVPPDDVPDAHGPYAISVTPNCFTPSSFITTIRKGHVEGEFIGSFEIGPNGTKIPSTVCLRGSEYPLAAALSMHPFRRNAWTWNTLDHGKPVTLHWEGKTVLACFYSEGKNQTKFVAQFTPKGAPPREGRAVVHAKLDITPQGHDLFDDIIMSVLIVERLRTMPNT